MYRTIFFFQAEDGIRDKLVTGVQTCALPIYGHMRDEDDELRLIERVLDGDGYVRLAFDEIRLAAGGYPQVTRRLEAALEDLKTVAPAERQPALDRQLRLLALGVERTLEDEDDRR